MKYEEILKIYFKYPNQLEAIYKERMNSDFIHIYDYKIGKFPLFVMQIPEISRLIDEIRKLDKKLNEFYLKEEIPKEAYQGYIYSCIVDEVFLTNEIEGVHSTRKEIQDVIESLENEGKFKGLRRFQGMVKKYMRLIGGDNSGQLVSPEDVRQLYNDIVLSEINPKDHPDGEFFRKGPVSVTAPGNGRSIHEGVLPEGAIHSQMSAALQILNSDNPNRLINIAVFHYLLGYIHPFYDGNGRTARFISSMYLTKELEDLVGFGLSYTIKEKCLTYAKMFADANDVRNRGDLTIFVIEFLSFVKNTIERIFRDLKERSSRLDFYTKKLMIHPCFSEDENVGKTGYIILQATLFSENRGIQSSELAKSLRVVTATLNKWRDKISPSLLSKRRDGKKVYYSINLDVLDNLK